jgi:hypothetical protein
MSSFEEPPRYIRDTTWTELIKTQHQQLELVTELARVGRNADSPT